MVWTACGEILRIGPKTKTSQGHLPEIVTSDPEAASLVEDRNDRIAIRMRGPQTSMTAQMAETDHGCNQINGVRSREEGANPPRNQREDLLIKKRFQRERSSSLFGRIRIGR